MSESLPAEIAFAGTDGSVLWRGLTVADRDSFRRYIAGRVRDRVRDADSSIGFAAELRDMATTGMTSEFVERLLRAVPQVYSWEIGEALAECVLAEDSSREVCWPWTTVRDRRTPRASLPGADLVGFCREGDAVFLLFGEVKTSSDAKTPPGVMLGRSGMSWQLEQQATSLEVQYALLKWLRGRCATSEHIELFHAATSRFVESAGREILVVGVLLRDTEATERDLVGRAKALASKLPPPTRIELIAWYLPVPIAEWPDLLHGGLP